ncbi:MAG: GSCFA domain-containing protein, partial [Bacteroidales bacterium]
MEFRKIVKIEDQSFGIGYENRILSLGSCFADHIGAKLKEAKIPVCSNPFGVLYNPVSVLNALKQLADPAEVTLSDLIEHHGLYHSFAFHSAFSDQSPENALLNMNKALRDGAESFSKRDRLLVTFGTAWIYEYTEENLIVSNCHKLPAKEFNRRRLTVSEITALWAAFLTSFAETHPGAKVVFTVSPIRHWKDGAFENQCSKATLILAVDELCKQFSFCSYFPSYEIFMDELRDYRFYAEDMIYPSAQGIEYVWERFGDTFFSAQTKEDMKEWEKLRKML